MVLGRVLRPTDGDSVRPTIVVGGQAGSEGKGAICDHLHRHGKYHAAVRIGGPNAGHTVVDGEGRRWALRQIPVAAVSDPECELYIAAGSEIDLDVLAQEVRQLTAAGFNVKDRLFIDQEASIIDAASHALELDIMTGTTGKGIGGVRAQRALRGATIARALHENAFSGATIMDTQPTLRAYAQEQHDLRLLIEGTQGYVLGSHAGEYPFATSGDCRAVDFMAACGLPPSRADVVVVLRCHPIRIAGNSGPLGHETTWGEIGVPPEQTTVTKKTRRVGHWDSDWARRSIASNGGSMCRVALTFVDYDFPGLAGMNGPVTFGELPTRLRDSIAFIQEDTGAPVFWLGTGPRTVIEVI